MTTQHTPFYIVPLPQRQPEIPLGDKTVVGRKTLSDLHIKSSQFKKKLSVSRQQAEIVVATQKAVILEALGMNPITITRKSGKELRLERGHKVFLTVGDVFTLCGKHFPFILNGYRVVDVPKEVKPAENGTPIKQEPSLEATESIPELEGSPNKSETMKRLAVDEVPQGSFLSPKGHQDPSLVKDNMPLIGNDLISKRVKVADVDQKWRKGTVAAYKEQTDQYQVVYEDGSSFSWEAPDDLVFVGEIREDMMMLKTKKRKNGSRGKVKKMLRLDDGGNSEEEKRELIARPVRKGGRVNYVEWESSSSEEENENLTVYKVSDKPKKPKNLTVVNPEQLSDKKTYILYHPSCLKHFVPKWHLEKPERLLCIMETLETLVHQFPGVLNIIQSFEPVSNSQLTTVHEEFYIHRMESNIPSTDNPEHVTQYSQEIDDRASQDFDTFMSKGSMEAARLAAGAACAAVDLVVSGQCKNAFCCIRPPGHHCGVAGHTEKAASQGYCIINNMAVAALYARNRYSFQRIAVVDFDVHHGNGTEEILGGREGFLFISVHVGSIYPRTGKEGKPRKSNVVCISLDSYSTSEVFHGSVDARVIPALEQYKPDLLMLSSGFDAHRKDPTENGMKLEEKDYFILTEKLKRIADKYCGGKIVSLLEGGYHLPSLKKCVREHIISLITK